jgi:predicted anti-sigma-YlaC factor YlaD
MVGTALGTSTRCLDEVGHVTSAVLSCVVFRQRAVALFHRTDQLKADSAERRERWNQVIAEHKKDQQKSKN